MPDLFYAIYVEEKSPFSATEVAQSIYFSVVAFFSLLGEGP